MEGKEEASGSKDHTDADHQTVDMDMSD